MCIGRTEIETYFQGDGLLVRTVQLKDLGSNFHDIGDNIDDALNKYKDPQYYGPKRRWSIAHPEIKPYFYKMEEDCPFARHYAILAIPSKVDWNRYFKISTKDESSNSKFSPGDTLLNIDVAQKEYHKVLEELKNGHANHNSEISTCGFDMSAFCGILYKGKKAEQPNMSELQKQLSYVHNTYGISEIPIFTYEENLEKTMRLQHIGCISYLNP